MHIPVWLNFSQDPNSDVALSDLQKKTMERYINSLSFLGLFHFVVNYPARLGFPRKQDGVGMHV